MRPQDLVPQHEEVLTPFSTWRMLLTCLFINAMIGGAFLSGKVILLAGYPITGSTLVFPLTYYVLALVADVYGLRTGWRLLWCGILCLILIYIPLEIILLAPDAPGSVRIDNDFRVLYTTAPSAFLVFAAAFFIGQATALTLLRFVRQRSASPALLFRLMCTPLFAQVVTTLLVLPLLYSRVYKGGDLLIFVFSRCIIAAIYSAFAFPLMYAISRFIRKHERAAALREVL